MVVRTIGEIGNFYGGLLTKQEEGRFYWGIESCEPIHWEQIPEWFYHCLVKYEEDRGPLVPYREPVKNVAKGEV